MFEDEIQREKELRFVKEQGIFYGSGFVAGLEFAAKIAERQRYGVAQYLREYKERILANEIPKCKMG